MSWFRSPIFLFSALLALAAALVLPWDAAIADWCRQQKLPGELRAVVRLAEAFAHGYGVVAIIISLLVIDPPRRKQILWVAAAAAFSGVASNLIKLNVIRLRPHAIESLNQQAWLTGFQGFFPWSSGLEDWLDRSLQAFPSGHTATAAGLATGLIMVYPQGRLWFALLAALAGLQRIDAGAHFPSDVLAGAALGVLCGGLTMRMSQRKAKRNSRSSGAKNPQRGKAA